MKFDEDRIRRLSSELLGAINRLKELSEMSEQEFIQDVHKMASAKYHFIVGIEAAIDMCNHIISQNKLRAPEDYADTFRVLAEDGAFSVGFLKRLIDAAKFRNRLVHIYWEVENKVLYEILKEDIVDLEKFFEDFIKFIGKKKSQ